MSIIGRMGLGLGSLALGRRAGGVRTWRATSLTLPAGATFLRSGTRPYFGATAWVTASSNQPRFDWQNGYPGLIMAGARTNKVTAAKSNPSATTNCTTSGDAAGVLSVVDDTGDIGVWAIFGPNVYKIDNSAGSTAFYVRFGGTTGGTSTHSISCIARGAGDMLLYDGTTETGVTAIDGVSYIRYPKNNLTPASSSQQFAVKCGAGEVAWVVVPQLEAARFADVTPIPGGTGSASVSAETMTRTSTLPVGGFTQVVKGVAPPLASFPAWNTAWAVGVSTHTSLRIVMQGAGASNFPATYNVKNATVEQALENFGTQSAGAAFACAVRFKSNDCKGSLSGAAATGADTSNTVVDGSVTEYFGHNEGSADHLFGWLTELSGSQTRRLAPKNDADLALASAL